MQADMQPCVPPIWRRQVRSIAVEYCDRQQALNEKLGEIYGAT